MTIETKPLALVTTKMVVRLTAHHPVGTRALDEGPARTWHTIPAF